MEVTLPELYQGGRESQLKSSMYSTMNNSKNTSPMVECRLEMNLFKVPINEQKVKPLELKTMLRKSMNFEPVKTKRDNQ